MLKLFLATYAVGAWCGVLLLMIGGTHITTKSWALRFAAIASVVAFVVIWWR